VAEGWWGSRTRTSGHAHITGKRASAREDCPSGIDVRRFLLAELLLLDTPLEPLLKGEKPQFQFLAPPVFDPAWVF
jgi:hypothetical protein